MVYGGLRQQHLGDVSNKSPWEIQKDIYEHNELLK